MNASPIGRGIAVPAVLALLMLAVLLGLGTWQIERKAWKEELIATLEQRLAAPPVALPPLDSALPPGSEEFTRVRFSAEFPHAADALVYSSGSALRDDAKGTGYFVFSVARLPDGRQVVVNRGFTPDRSYPAVSGPQNIVGALRWPETPSLFVADHDSKGEIWTVRDPVAMARVKQWGRVEPYYIEQEAPVPPSGVPHPSPLKVQLRNEHLQYAITWYGLATVLVVMFAIWASRRRRAV